MGNYSFEMIARGVPRRELFNWFTDFSDDDAEISKRRGVDLLQQRKVTRRGNSLHVENELLSRGNRSKFVIDVVLHPENYTYDVEGGNEGIKSNMRFAFTDVPGIGSKVTVNCTYELLNTELKTRDASGLVNKELKEGQQRLVAAFLDEAQEQLSLSAKNP